MPEPTLDLQRTKQAVDAYEKFWATLEKTPDATDEQWAEEERLAKAVGEAFALDTSDRNDPATARLMRPRNPWLRSLLAKYAK